MKQLKAIIESPTTPPSNVLWLNSGEAKYFKDGKWVPIGESSEDRKELEEKVDSIDKEVGNIINDLSKLGSKQGVIELEIGDSTEVKARNLEKLKSVQTNDHTFFCDINYGYGTGDWLPTVGGDAFIITSEGHAKQYKIGTDGTIVAGRDINLSNPSTELFEVVTELPTENISTSKLYCVLSSTQGEQNKYTEYAYIKQTDGSYAWEKMGEFAATPDLSKYANLGKSNSYTGPNSYYGAMTCHGGFSLYTINAYSNGKYLLAQNANDRSATATYNSGGGITQLGAEESFVFTLEDGTKVTKSIRVVSTTNT